MDTTDRPQHHLETGATAVVCVLGFVAAYASYQGVSPLPAGSWRFAYVELFTAPIAVLALVDLVRRRPFGGALYRGVLGVVGLLFWAVYSGDIDADGTLVLAAAVYLLSIATAVWAVVGARREAATA